METQNSISTKTLLVMSVVQNSNGNYYSYKPLTTIQILNSLNTNGVTAELRSQIPVIFGNLVWIHDPLSILITDVNQSRDALTEF